MELIKVIFVLLLFGCDNKPCHYETKSIELEEFLRYQDGVINVQNDIIKQGYNSVVRLQLIAGVDTIDSVFTYKEKLLNSINTKNLTKEDLR